MRLLWLAVICCSLAAITASTAGGVQTESATRPQPAPQLEQDLVARFDFDANLKNAIDSRALEHKDTDVTFVKGLDGEALRLNAVGTPALQLPHDKLPLTSSHDFSVQFWVKTVANAGKRFVIVSKKTFPDNSLAAQKNAGWAFCFSGGTWAWHAGSGSRRIVYERDNGTHMPLNDGRWHQLTMTYRKVESCVRLYYDGQNKVLYNVEDSNGFDFSNSEPFVVGLNDVSPDSQTELLPAISSGADQLQELVDRFNALGLSKGIDDDDLMRLVIGPRSLLEQKLSDLRDLNDPANDDQIQILNSVDLGPVEELASRLQKNPYTVHQSADFMKVAPLLKVYGLIDGKVRVNQTTAKAYSDRERLDRPDFDIDNLSIWDRALSSEEILRSYSKYFQPVVVDLPEHLSSLTVAAWNIHHGGKHETVEEDGWDSRLAIAEIIKRENIDIVMMQETYSSGDFLAAELGYFFATTIDWDYLNQGSNISVLSRFPIVSIDVPPSSPFMNVAARVSLSKTQDMYAMSNWYGMADFPAVADYHEAAFAKSNRVPVLFAGDFNAVPHADGGNSPASKRLLESGFVDAYRSLHPNVTEHPGATHQSGRRIDQLYFKGDGLKNVSTTVHSSWPSVFPSDHFLIKSVFELNYATVRQ